MGLARLPSWLPARQVSSLACGLPRHRTYRASAPLRVEAGGNGMRVVWPLRSTYLSWDRIVEVRGNAGRWSEYLVVVRPDGSLVRLPPGLPQDVVDGWRPPSGTTSVQASPP